MFGQSLFRALTAILWFATIPVMAAGWLFNLPILITIATVASLLFVLSLMVTIWRELPPLTLPQAATGFPGFGLTVVSIIAAILVALALGSSTNPWIVLSLPLALVGLYFAVAWRREITPQLVLLAIASGLICIGLGFASGDHGVLRLAYYLSVSLAILGGGVMVRHIGLARLPTADGKWLAALGAFGLGVVLALPSSFLNLASGIQNADKWVDQLWEPLVALVPGIAEESIARLLLLTLCVVLLRQRTGAKRWTVIIAALLISTYAHALAHVSLFEVFSPAGGMMMLAGLLFGLPMGLVFLRFGFEAAVGYHFTVDFVRFLAAYFVFG